MIVQSKPFIEKNDFDYIDAIVRSGQIARGRFVEELQREFCKVIGMRYALTTSSGTAALHLALLSLNIGQGDEVIIPSYTCTALLNAVNYVNGVPVIIDIDHETFNITYNIIKKKITKKTKAIIVTHTFGFPANMDEILKLGIPVIEDCAHAIGSTYKGKPTGGIGIASVFSMHAPKMLSAGEGGMICTDDKKLSEVLLDLNNPDMRDSYRVRYNYKMSDLTAGLALKQLKKLKFFTKRRTFIAEQYRKFFFSLPIELQQPLSGTIPSYYRFAVCTPKSKKIINFTQTYGIICDKPIYKPLHHYLNSQGDISFSGTDYIWNRAISIPIYPALKDEEITTIIDILLKAFDYCKS